MKISFLTLIAALFSITAYAQILNPISWSYASKKTSATEATVFIKATIDDRWHLYSQFVKEGGPVKTTFTFPTSADYILVGKTVEPNRSANLRRHSICLLVTSKNRLSFNRK
jgi:hypothetical protein